MTGENDTVRLDTAAKEKQLTALGLVKKLNPKHVFVTRAALDSIETRTRGRSPEKWLNDAMQVFGITRQEAEVKYVEWRRLNPAPNRTKK